ncbi:MAG: PepSY domain-containing protein [Gammaproteobacteria bacterium]|nr:PepSY domain-containing protein [Gammaproteobacteria bacterium]MCW8988145.1 PepSY domain-containing protein [Gammaproteobacteria bacterium]MCW9031912.1 PepSY domain-containing protein [Gammaproteobacteria bacterium]
MTRHKKHGVKLRSMYQWHRYVGVNVALFILILAVTGIMLNHTGRLELDKKYIQAEWLLTHYGIAAPENIKNYQIGKKWLSQWDDQLYLDSHAIGETDKSIIGAVLFQSMFIIAQNDTLLIYTLDGELIERVAGSEGVPSGIEAIGITDKDELAVRAANGVFTTNQEFLFWQKTPAAISVWSDSAVLPKTLYQNILELYRGKGLTLERVFLDLHSGRLLGDWGIYFTDFIAILMIFLASSGFWIWSMRIYKTKKHHKH